MEIKTVTNLFLFFTLRLLYVCDRLVPYCSSDTWSGTYKSKLRGIMFSRRFLLVVYRAPATDPGGSCTGSQLSTISWHLNLPLNLTLTLIFNFASRSKKEESRLPDYQSLKRRLHFELPGPRRLQSSAVRCQPIIVTAGARSPEIGCRLPVHDTLRFLLQQSMPPFH